MIDNRETAKSLGFPTVRHKASGRMAVVWFVDLPVRVDIEWVDGPTEDGEATATVLPSDLAFDFEKGVALPDEPPAAPVTEELELSPVQDQLAADAAAVAETPAASE